MPAQNDGGSTDEMADFAALSAGTDHPHPGYFARFTPDEKALKKGYITAPPQDN